MATFHLPILGSGTLPDTTGSVYQEPAAVNYQSNDRYPFLVWVFADTATRITLGGTFRVPQNYATGGTTKVGLVWSTTATSGNSDWEFDYTAIADNEPGDPSADQETVDAGAIAADGTARDLKVTEITLTASNFAAGDLVQFRIARDGAQDDTIAASLYLLAAYFSYTDS